MTTTTTGTPSELHRRRGSRKIDGRSSAAKRLRVLQREIAETFPSVPAHRRFLIDRLAACLLAAEVQERMLANNDPRFNADTMLRLSGTVMRLQNALGLAQDRAAEDRAPKRGRTIRDLFDGDLPDDHYSKIHEREQLKRPSRHVVALLDEDDEVQRVMRGEDDAPGLPLNAERDARVAKAGAGPSGPVKFRRMIKRKTIRSST